jgi:hypothetical protein
LPAKNLTGHAGEIEKLKEFRSAPEIVTVFKRISDNWMITTLALQLLDCVAK